MSATANTQKTSITLTLEPEQKQLLEKAAALRCLTVSEYLLQLALLSATEEIPEPEAITASDRDWSIIESTILNPPAANPVQEKNRWEDSRDRNTMKNAVDVARYFLRRVDREAGDTISLLKLQKLVYYAQAWSLVLRNKPFYYQDVEAWPSGPVVRDVWNEYKDYKYGDIFPPDDLDVEFEEDEIEVLEEVWDTYGELSARYLRDLTHSETPWSQARKGLEPAQKSTNKIDARDMTSYYSN